MYGHRLLIIHKQNSLVKKSSRRLLLLRHLNMPFRSKRQSRLFFATMPDTAKEWASKTDYSKLPEKVKKKKKKKKDKNDCGEKALQMATQYERHVNASLLKP